MKQFLATMVVMMISGAAFGQTYTAPATPVRPIQPKPAPPPVATRNVEGVVPRALRGGNPLQMVNPAAPARYGTAEQSVMVKPDGSGKWNGIRLFVINF